MLYYKGVERVGQCMCLPKKKMYTQNIGVLSLTPSLSVSCIFFSSYHLSLLQM